jgi:hypothetical protein
MSASIHLLDVQRKAKKARIIDPKRRKYLDFSPLKTLVRSTSSPNTTNISEYLKSPALQKSNSFKTTNIANVLLSNTTTKRTNFYKLPHDLIKKIHKEAFYQNEYVLREWIDINKLDLKELARNPNSISFFYKKFKSNPDDVTINWYELSDNPNAVQLIKKKILYEKTQNLSILNSNQKINWSQLSRNPNVIKLLEQKIKEEKTIDSQRLNELSNNDKIQWKELSKNPNAIELLKANKEKITIYIFDNKNLDQTFIKFLLDENYDIPWSRIWTISKVIRLLLKKFPDPNLINWNQLSQNTSYKAIELLKAKMIEEKLLIEQNPKAYESLDSIKKISWQYLSKNPKAIQLLTNKAQEEKKIREENPTAYYKLRCKVDWSALSRNPKAIKLLEEKAIEEKELKDKNLKSYEKLDNSQKINWYDLSSNPKAIKLLEEKAIEEKELREKNPEYYKSSYYNTKIDSKKLSANPRAIQLLQQYPEYIDLSGLCENPNAVNLIKKNIDKLTKENWYILSSNPCIFYEK